MKVILNTAEKRLCNYIARCRTELSREVIPINDNLVATNPHNIIEEEGVMGELAFCKIMQVYPEEIFDPSVKSAERGTDPGDLNINNICIDIKTTKYRNGRLICRSINKAINLIILMTGEKGEYTFSGGLWSADMYSEERWGSHQALGGGRPCYLAEQHELIQPDELIRQIKEA